jgi:signal transduction histidine kinase
LLVLAEASQAFASVVTDYEQLLLTIVRTTADRIGDGCLVTLLGEDGDTLVSAATAHRDPALELDYKAYHLGRRFSKNGEFVAASVIRTGQSRVETDIDPATVVAQVDEELRPLTMRLNVHAFAVVPIRARARTLGTLSAFRSHPGGTYVPEDVTLLEDLASRAGLAIDNARLYAELEDRVERRTALLQQANAELDAFGYSVAHDLRAPLRAIDGFARGLLTDAAGRLEAEERGDLERIVEAARRMGRLIDDLLGLSRIVTSELHRETVNLSVFAREILARLAQAQPGRRVEIVVADDLFALCDRRLVGIALENLLGNAWKYSSRRAIARIEVGIARPGSVPEFFVRDDGAGFDPAYASKLFAPFQRLHSASEFEGTGIGLATVQRIVRRHEGHIRAEGRPGEGASFYFTLGP